jgi:hypothetical protein
MNARSEAMASDSAPDATLPTPSGAGGTGDPAWLRFYEQVLPRAELIAASHIDDIDGEIAVLRVKLKKSVEERPDDLALLLRLSESVARLTATRFRMQPREAEDLARRMATVIRDINNQMADAQAEDV